LGLTLLCLAKAKHDLVWFEYSSIQDPTTLYKVVIEQIRLCIFTVSDKTFIDY
jgi:hypothetical protein